MNDDERIKHERKFYSLGYADGKRNTTKDVIDILKYVESETKYKYSFFAKLLIKNIKRYLIGDSIEGWADLRGFLISGSFST